MRNLNMSFIGVLSAYIVAGTLYPAKNPTDTSSTGQMISIAYGSDTSDFIIVLVPILNTSQYFTARFGMDLSFTVDYTETFVFPQNGSLTANYFAYQPYNVVNQVGDIVFIDINSSALSLTENLLSVYNGNEQTLLTYSNIIGISNGRQVSPGVASNDALYAFSPRGLNTWNMSYNSSGTAIGAEMQLLDINFNLTPQYNFSVLPNNVASLTNYSRGYFGGNFLATTIVDGLGAVTNFSVSNGSLTINPVFNQAQIYDSNYLSGVLNPNILTRSSNIAISSIIYFQGVITLEYLFYDESMNTITEHVVNIIPDMIFNLQYNANMYVSMILKKTLLYFMINTGIHVVDLNPYAGKNSEPVGYYFTKNHICNPNAQRRIAP